MNPFTRTPTLSFLQPRARLLRARADLLRARNPPRKSQTRLPLLKQTRPPGTPFLFELFRTSFAASARSLPVQTRLPQRAEARHALGAQVPPPLPSPLKNVLQALQTSIHEPPRDESDRRAPPRSENRRGLLQLQSIRRSSPSRSDAPLSRSANSPSRIIRRSMPSRRSASMWTRSDR